jgi:septum formation protein
MLAQLSGRTHEVLSGVALLADKPAYRLSISRVSFRPISPGEAAAYWTTGEPADKAGAYAVQGLAAAFIERIEGSYSGIMGLPLFETLEMLRGAGLRGVFDINSPDE